MLRINYKICIFLTQCFLLVITECFHDSSNSKYKKNDSRVRQVISLHANSKTFYLPRSVNLNLLSINWLHIRYTLVNLTLSWLFGLFSLHCRFQLNFECKHDWILLVKFLCLIRKLLNDHFERESNQSSNVFRISNCLKEFDMK